MTWNTPIGNPVREFGVVNGQGPDGIEDNEEDILATGCNHHPTLEDATVSPQQDAQPRLNPSST